MKSRLFIAVLAVVLCSDLLAAEQRKFAEVTLCGAGGNTTHISQKEFVILVVQGPDLFFDKKPIPAAQVVDFVNGLLKANNLSYIGLYAREGTKYGEVVRAIDTLRATDAKNIGLSMTELPIGREP
jgi:biopolymer transport protein ExbD